MRRALILGCVAALAACDGEGGSGSSDSPCKGGICGSTGGNTTGSGGSDGCSESWTCTSWEENAQGMYERSCSDDNACGTTASKPEEGPVALPALDMELYKCSVEPIFDRDCSHQGCHGVEQGRVFRMYARGRFRNDEIVAFNGCLNTDPVNLQEEGTGTVMCVGWTPHTAAEWDHNYNNARSFMLGVSDPADSELLAQTVYGGAPHVGVHFYNPGDPDYQAIAAWLGGATLGTPCDTGAN